MVFGDDSHEAWTLWTEERIDLVDLLYQPGLGGVILASLCCATRWMRSVRDETLARTQWILAIADVHEPTITTLRVSRTSTMPGLESGGSLPGLSFVIFLVVEAEDAFWGYPNSADAVIHPARGDKILSGLVFRFWAIHLIIKHINQSIGKWTLISKNANKTAIWVTIVSSYFWTH